MNTLIPPPLDAMSPTAQHYLSTASASSDPVPGRPMTTPLQAPRNVLQMLGYFDNTLPTAHGYVDPARIDGEGAWRDRFLGFGEGVPWTRETHTPGLPDSLLGRNSYMMSTINASVIGSGDFYAGELLPYSDAGHIHVAWDVLRMNEQLAHRSPEEGVTRLLTWEKHTRTQNAVRRGLAMQLESDTFHTPEGARHFMMELDGLIRAVRATINLDVMTALMDCAQQRDAREEGAKRYRGVAGLTRVAVREIDSYALLQSRAHGLEILIAEAREQMSRRGALPDTVVLPPGAVAFLSQRPEYQGVFSAYSRQVGAQVYGCKVYEAEYVCVGDRASTTAGERDMRCPLVRPTDVGEQYHVTDGGAVSLSVLNACNTALTLYSEIQDRWIDVPMRKLLKYGNNRFGGARDGAVHLNLGADSTLTELAEWASKWWDKLCGTLMPRDGRMLLRPDWLLWRDWTVKSSWPNSYKTVLTMWHLSQAQFPSLFTPLSLSMTRLMQKDIFASTLDFGTRLGPEAEFAGEPRQSASVYAKNFDGMLWFAVAQTMPVAGDSEISASAVPNDFALVQQGSVDAWQDGGGSAKRLSLRITSAYWHYVNAQYKGRLPSPGTVGALYNDSVGNANAARTASNHGCGAGIVDAHHFQISLLMWDFCHKYEEHCVQSGYTGSLRNGTLSTLRNFVHVLFRQSQNKEPVRKGEREIKREALKRAVKRVERAENHDVEWADWLQDALVASHDSNDNGAMGDLLQEFERLCEARSLDSSRYVYPLPNVWAALLDAVGTCKIAGTDAHTLTRVSSALERADARFAERVACCVGGRGVVDVGKDHVKCPTHAEMPASSKRRRGRGDDDGDDDKTVEEDAANSAVATRIEDVTYMAALFAVYACDLLSASVGAVATQMPLAAYIPDAVLDTYAQEWHRVYHLTEASRLSVFDNAYLQGSFGRAKWQRRLHGCAMALSLTSDGIFAVLGSADLSCHNLSATWRENNLTERASVAFGSGSRVTAALAVPPTSLALLLFVSRAYEDLARRNDACEYPDITGDVAELVGHSKHSPSKRRRHTRTAPEEMSEDFDVSPLPRVVDPFFTPRDGSPRRSPGSGGQEPDLPKTDPKWTRKKRQFKSGSGSGSGSDSGSDSEKPKRDAGVLRRDDAVELVTAYRDELYAKAVLLRDWIFNCDYESLLQYKDNSETCSVETFDKKKQLMEKSMQQMKTLLDLCGGKRPSELHDETMLVDLVQDVGDDVASAIVEAVVQQRAGSEPTDVFTFSANVTSLSNSFAMFFVANDCFSLQNIYDDEDERELYMLVMEIAQDVMINESVMCVGMHLGLQDLYTAQYDGLAAFREDSEHSANQKLLPMPRDMEVLCVELFNRFWVRLKAKTAGRLANKRLEFAKSLVAKPIDHIVLVNVKDDGKFTRVAGGLEQPVEPGGSVELRTSSPEVSLPVKFVVDLFAEIAAACAGTLDTSVDYKFLLRKELCAVATPDSYSFPKSAPDSVMLCVFAETMRSVYGSQMGEYEQDGQWQWAAGRLESVRKWVVEGTCLFNFLREESFKLSLSNILQGLFAVAQKMALSRGVKLQFDGFNEDAVVKRLDFGWMADASELRVARRVYGAQVDDSLFTLLCAVAELIVSNDIVQFEHTDVLRMETEAEYRMPDAVCVQPQTWFSPSVYAFPATSAVKFTVGDVDNDAAVVLDMTLFKNLDFVGSLDIDIANVSKVVGELTRQLNTPDVLDSVTDFASRLSEDALLGLDSCREELRANLYGVQSLNTLSLAQRAFRGSLRATLGAGDNDTITSVLLCALDLQTGGLVQEFVHYSALKDYNFKFTPRRSLLSERQLMRPDNLTLVLHSLKDDPLLQMANTRIERLDAQVPVQYDKWESDMVGYTLRGTEGSVHSDYLLSWDQSKNMTENLQQMFISFCDKLIRASALSGHGDVWWINMFFDSRNSETVPLNAFGNELQYLANHLISFQTVSSVMGVKLQWFEEEEEENDKFFDALDTFKKEELENGSDTNDEERAQLRKYVIDQMTLRLLQFVGTKLPSANSITPYVQWLFLETYNWRLVQEAFGGELEIGNVRHAVFLYDTGVGFPTPALLNDRETEMRYYADCVLDGRFDSFHDGSIQPYRAETAATMFNCGDMSPPLDDGFVSWRGSGTGGIVHMLVLFAGVSVDNLLTDENGRRTTSWKQLRSTEEVNSKRLQEARDNIRSRAVCIALTMADKREIEQANAQYREKGNASVHDLMEWHKVVASVLGRRRKTVQQVIDQEIALFQSKLAIVDKLMPYEYCVYVLYVDLLQEMQKCAVQTLAALRVSVNLMYKLELKAIFKMTLYAAPFVPPLDVQCHRVSLEQWLQGEPRGEEDRKSAADLYRGFRGWRAFESHQRCANASGLLPTQHAASSTSSYAVGATVELARIVQLQRYELCQDSENYVRDWFEGMKLGPFALCQTVLQKATELQRVRDASQSRDIAEVKNDGVWRASEFALAALAYRTQEYGSVLWMERKSSEERNEELDEILLKRAELQAVIDAVPKQVDKELTAGMQCYGDAVAFARAAALDTASASTMAVPNRLLLCGVLAQCTTFTPEFFSNLCHMGQCSTDVPLEGQSLHNSPSSASCRASLRYKAAEEMMRQAEDRSLFVSAELVRDMSYRYSLDAQYQLNCQLTALRNEFAQVRGDDVLRRAMALSNGVSPFNVSVPSTDAELLRTMEAQLSARFERNCGLSRWQTEDLNISAATITGDSSTYYRKLQEADEAGADMFVASLWQPSCDIAKICSAGAELLHAKRDWWKLRYKNNSVAKKRSDTCVFELMKETYNDFNGEIPICTRLDNAGMKFKVGLALRGVFCGAGSQFVYESGNRRLQNEFCTEIAHVVSSNDEYSWHKLAKVDAVTNKMRKFMNNVRGDVVGQITDKIASNAFMDANEVKMVCDAIQIHCGAAIEQALVLSNNDADIALTALAPLFDCLRKDCQQMVDYLMKIFSQKEQIQMVRDCISDLLAIASKPDEGYDTLFQGQTDSMVVNLRRVEEVNGSSEVVKLYGVLPGLSSRSQEILEEFEASKNTLRGTISSFVEGIGGLLMFLHERKARADVAYAPGGSDEKTCTVAAQKVWSLVRVVYATDMFESDEFRSAYSESRQEVSESFETFFRDILEWNDITSPVAIEALLQTVTSARKNIHARFAKAYVISVNKRLSGESLDGVNFTNEISRLVECARQDDAAGMQPKIIDRKFNREFDLRVLVRLHDAITQELAVISDRSLQSAYLNAMIDGAIAGPKLWGVYVQEHVSSMTSNEMLMYHKFFARVDVEGEFQTKVKGLWDSLNMAVPPLKSGGIQKPIKSQTISCRDNARLMQLCGRMLEKYDTVDACKEQLHEAMDRFSVAAVDSRGLVTATSVASDGALSRRARGVAQRVLGRAQRGDLEELSLHESTFAARSCTHQLSALCSHVDWGQRDGSDTFVDTPSVYEMLEIVSDSLTLLQRDALTLVKGQGRRAGQGEVYVVTVDCFGDVWFTAVADFLDSLARLEDVENTLLDDLPAEAFDEASVADNRLQPLCSKLKIGEAELRLKLLVINKGVYSPLLAKEMLLHAQLAKTPSVKLSGDDKWELTHVCDPDFYNQWVAVLGAGATRQDGTGKGSLLSLDPCGHMHFSSARRYASLTRLYAARAANGDDSANPRWDEERHVRAVLRRDADELNRYVFVNVEDGSELKVEVEDERYLSPHVFEICQAIRRRLETLSVDEVFDMHEFAMFPSSMYSNQRVRVRIGTEIEVENGTQAGEFRTVELKDGDGESTRILRTVGKLHADYLRFGCDQDTPTYGDTCFALLHDHMAAFGRDSMVDLHYRKPTLAPDSIVRRVGKTLFATWMSHDMLSECYAAGCDHQLMIAAVYFARLSSKDENSDNLYDCVNAKTSLIDWCRDVDNMETSVFYAAWAVAFEKVATSFVMTPLFSARGSYAKEFSISPELCILNSEWTMWLSLRTLQEEKESEVDMQLRAMAQSMLADSSQQTRKRIVSMLLAPEVEVQQLLARFAIADDTQPSRAVSLLVVKLARSTFIYEDERADEAAFEATRDLYDEVVRYTNFVLVASMLTLSPETLDTALVAEMKPQFLEVCEVRQSLFDQTKDRNDLKLGLQEDDILSDKSTVGWFVLTRFLCDSEYDSGYGFTDLGEFAGIETAAKECRDVRNTKLDDEDLANLDCASRFGTWGANQQAFDAGAMASAYCDKLLRHLTDKFQRAPAASFQRFFDELRTGTVYRENPEGGVIDDVDITATVLCPIFETVSDENRGADEFVRRVSEFATKLCVVVRENFDSTFYKKNGDLGEESFEAFRIRHRDSIVVVETTTKGLFAIIVIKPDHNPVEGISESLKTFAAVVDKDSDEVRRAEVLFAADIVELVESAVMRSTVKNFGSAILGAIETCNKNYKVFALLDECSACGTSFELAVSQCTEAVCCQMKSASAQFVRKAYASGCDCIAEESSVPKYSVRAFQHRVRAVEYGVAKTLGVLQCRFLDGLEKFAGDTRAGRNALGESKNFSLNVSSKQETRRAEDFLKTLRGWFCMDMPSATAVERRNPLWLFEKFQSSSVYERGVLEQFEWLNLNLRVPLDPEFLALKWHWCCIDTAWQTDQKYVDLQNPQTFVEGVHGEHDTQVGCRTPFEHERDVRNFLHPSNLQTLMSALDDVEVLPHSSSSAFSWIENGSVMSKYAMCLFALSNSQYFRQSVDRIDEELRFLAVDTQCSILQFAGLNETGGECAFPGMYGDCRHLLHQPRTAADRAIALLCRIQTYASRHEFFESQRSLFSWKEIEQAMQATAAAAMLLKEMLAIVVQHLIKSSDSVVEFAYSIDAQESELAELLIQAGIEMYDETAEDLLAPRGHQAAMISPWVRLPRNLVVGKLPDAGLYVLRQWWSELITAKGEGPYNFLQDSHTKRKLISTFRPPDKTPTSPYFETGRESGLVQLKVYSCSAYQDGAIIAERTLGQHFDEFPPHDVDSRMLRLCAEAMPDSISSEGELHLSTLKKIPLNSHNVSGRMREAMDTGQGLESRFTMRERRSLIDVCPTIYGSTRLCTLQRTDEQITPRDQGEVNEAMRAMHVGVQVMRTPMSSQVDAAVQRRLDAIYTDKGYAYTRADDTANTLKESLQRYYGGFEGDAVTEPITAVDLAPAVYEAISPYLAQGASAAGFAKEYGPLTSAWVRQSVTTKITQPNQEEVDVVDFYAQKKIESMIVAAQQQQECALINRQRAVNADDAQLNERRDSHSSFFYGRWVANVRRQPDMFDVVTASRVDNAAFSEDKTNGSYLRCKQKTEEISKEQVTKVLSDPSVYSKVHGASDALSKFYTDRSSTMHWLKATVLANCVKTLEKFASYVLYPDGQTLRPFNGNLRGGATQFMQLWATSKVDIQRIVGDSGIIAQLQEAYHCAQRILGAINQIHKRCVRKFKVREIASVSAVTLPETYLFRYMFEDIFVNLAVRLAAPNVNTDDLLIAFAMQPPVFYEQMRAATAVGEFAEILKNHQLPAVALEEEQLPALCIACCNAALGQRLYHLRASNDFRVPCAIDNAAMLYLGYELAYSSMSASRQSLWEYTLFDSAVANSAAMQNELYFNHSVARIWHIMWAHREIVGSVHEIDLQKEQFLVKPYEENPGFTESNYDSIFLDSVKDLKPEEFGNILGNTVKGLRKHYLSNKALQRTVKGHFTMLLQHNVLVLHVLEQANVPTRKFSYLRLLDVAALPEAQRQKPLRALTNAEGLVLYSDKWSDTEKYGFYSIREVGLPFLDLDVVRRFVSRVKTSLPASYRKCYFKFPKGVETDILEDLALQQHEAPANAKYYSVAADLVSRSQNPRTGFIPMGWQQYMYALTFFIRVETQLCTPCKMTDTFVQPADVLTTSSGRQQENYKIVGRAIAGITSNYKSESDLYNYFATEQIAPDYSIDDSHFMASLEDRAPLLAAKRSLVTFECTVELAQQDDASAVGGEVEFVRVWLQVPQATNALQSSLRRCDTKYVQSLCFSPGRIELVARDEDRDKLIREDKWQDDPTWSEFQTITEQYSARRYGLLFASAADVRDAHARLSAQDELVYTLQESLHKLVTRGLLITFTNIFDCECGPSWVCATGSIIDSQLCQLCLECPSLRFMSLEPVGVPMTLEDLVAHRTETRPSHDSAARRQSVLDCQSSLALRDVDSVVPQSHGTLMARVQGLNDSEKALLPVRVGWTCRFTEFVFCDQDQWVLPNTAQAVSNQAYLIAQEMVKMVKTGDRLRDEQSAEDPVKKYLRNSLTSANSTTELSKALAAPDVYTCDCVKLQQVYDAYEQCKEIGDAYFNRHNMAPDQTSNMVANRYGMLDRPYGSDLHFAFDALNFAILGPHIEAQPHHLFEEQIHALVLALCPNYQKLNEWQQDVRFKDDRERLNVIATHCGVSRLQLGLWFFARETVRREIGSASAALDRLKPLYEKDATGTLNLMKGREYSQEQQQAQRRYLQLLYSQLDYYATKDNQLLSCAKNLEIGMAGVVALHSMLPQQKREDSANFERIAKTYGHVLSCFNVRPQITASESTLSAAQRAQRDYFVALCGSLLDAELNPQRDIKGRLSRLGFSVKDDDTAVDVFQYAFFLTQMQTIPGTTVAQQQLREAADTIVPKLLEDIESLTIDRMHNLMNEFLSAEKKFVVGGDAKGDLLERMGVLDDFLKNFPNALNEWAGTAVWTAEERQRLYEFATTLRLFLNDDTVTTRVLVLETLWQLVQDDYCRNFVLQSNDFVDDSNRPVGAVVVTTDKASTMPLQTEGGNRRHPCVLYEAEAVKGTTTYRVTFPKSIDNAQLTNVYVTIRRACESMPDESVVFSWLVCGNYRVTLDKQYSEACNFKLGNVTVNPSDRVYVSLDADALRKTCMCRAVNAKYVVPLRKTCPIALNYILACTRDDPNERGFLYTARRMWRPSVQALGLSSGRLYSSADNVQLLASVSPLTSCRQLADAAISFEWGYVPRSSEAYIVPYTREIVEDVERLLSPDVWSRCMRKLRLNGTDFDALFREILLCSMLGSHSEVIAERWSTLRASSTADAFCQMCDNQFYAKVRAAFLYKKLRAQSGIERMRAAFVIYAVQSFVELSAPRNFVKSTFMESVFATTMLDKEQVQAYVAEFEDESTWDPASKNADNPLYAALTETALLPLQKCQSAKVFDLTAYLLSELEKNSTFGSARQILRTATTLGSPFTGTYNPEGLTGRTGTNLNRYLQLFTEVLWYGYSYLREKAIVRNSSSTDAGCYLAAALAVDNTRSKKVHRLLREFVRRNGFMGADGTQAESHVVRNMKLHVVATRPVIRHMMGSTIVMKRGDSTGRTLIGPENDFQIKQLPEPAGGQYYGNLTFYSKAFVQEQKNVHVKTGSFAVAYMNGNDTGPLCAVKSGTGNPLALVGDILTCVLPESYDKAYSLRGCNGLQEDIFGVWSEAMASVADCADAVDGSNGVHFACGPYNYMHLRGWQTMANRPLYLHMKTAHGVEYNDSIVHDWTDKRSSGFFGCERNTICYPGPHVALAIDELQKIDNQLTRRLQHLRQYDRIATEYHETTQLLFASISKPERACHGSGHWKNSVGVGFAGGRSGRYDVLDRRNAHMPAYAYGSVEPGEYNTSGRPTIVAATPLAGVYGACTNPHRPSLGTVLNGATY